ncbi:hypothetical protein LUZ60_003207 [Juncus effusus]|nr:hypothetical protein LUZ60_003207 [Juncus effusus]
MEEQQLNSIALTHLLQHSLRSLCVSESSDWVYAVFWRILPRNYPPPKWDFQIGGRFFDRTRGNRRNWILAWEDGFCNFSPSTIACDYKTSEDLELRGLQPEIFFKMSHEIYNYGEGLIGKVASDKNHKWIFSEPQYQETNNHLTSYNNPSDFYPRTWEAQFQSGIKTIALIGVREGVVQLGSLKKVEEDLSYIVLLRKNFSYIESIPGVLLPHPSSALFPVTEHFIPNTEFYEDQNVRFTPSMSSLEALLSKLPPVGPTESQPIGQQEEMERIGGGESSGYFVNM